MPATKLLVDDRFIDHFRGYLAQVFLYITDECNLRCTQCYYKPWLQTGHAEMDTGVMFELLAAFRGLGARKLSLLGGEPTLYGQAPGNLPLPAIAKYARELGFEYIRVVTNGLFNANRIKEGLFGDFDEVTFSMDGDSPNLHDRLRGRGHFIQTLENLRLVIATGQTVQVTTCVHRGNIGKTEDGQLLLDRAIRWAQDEGVSVINFHPLFKMDIPRDSWSGPTDIDPVVWTEVYNQIRKNIEEGCYRIAIRIPQRFVTTSEFNRHKSSYGYCPVKMRERIEVHPNGQIHSCALNNGTPIALARFALEQQQLRLRWIDGTNNEIKRYPFDLTESHPCAIMARDFSGLAPLCISFKPHQSDFYWNTQVAAGEKVPDAGQPSPT
jgi:MoaA/NifB/PqqE/SkfB family radical SAM enzyme